VVHGTHRPEDLIPAFMFALEEISQEAATRVTSEYIGEGWPYSMDGLGFGPYDEYTDEMKELTPHLLEDLFEALGEVAPDGHYFGAHPGDGSDFGFWPVEEEI